MSDDESLSSDDTDNSTEGNMDENISDVDSSFEELTTALDKEIDEMLASLEVNAPKEEPEASVESNDPDYSSLDLVDLF